MTKLLRLEVATLKCRVALLTSLYFAGLKAWEAIETIHLGIAGIFQVGRVDYTRDRRIGSPKMSPRRDSVGSNENVTQRGARHDTHETQPCVTPCANGLGLGRTILVTELA
jgi:hypothetical protein